MNENKCLFCNIIAGHVNAYRIMENELSMVILDIQPYTKGHCLVIPKRHIRWWHEMTDEETTSIFSIAKKTTEKLMIAFGPDFVSMTTRGRHIPHAHIHLIPTHSGDVIDSFFNALEKFQEAPPELMQLRTPSSMEEVARRLKVGK